MIYAREAAGWSQKMEAIERLKSERAELTARLARIEAVIAQHDALQLAVDELLHGGVKISVTSSRRGPKSGANAESGGRRVTANVASFERAIKDILRVTPEPLTRNDLYNICIQRNIPVGGMEPLNTLASRMSRMAGVKNVRGKGYFLEDRLGELMPRPELKIPYPVQSIVDTNVDTPNTEMPKPVSDLSDLLTPS